MKITLVPDSDMLHVFGKFSHHELVNDSKGNLIFGFHLKYLFFFSFTLTPVNIMSSGPLPSAHGDKVVVYQT